MLILVRELDERLGLVTLPAEHLSDSLEPVELRAWSDSLLWTFAGDAELSPGHSLTRQLGESFAASVISSVIALAKPENRSERTKADERI